jgi:predicted metal-dependent hydrolase
MTPPRLPYLAGYPPELIAQVQRLVSEDRLAAHIQARYPDTHDVRTDGALYEYVSALKSRFMRNAGPLAKVVYDNRLHLLHNALGTHTQISRVQGGQLKAKREIRIAGLFRVSPPEFLRTIVVHELAHLKVQAHDKAFYALCTHMEPQYHQLEFDLRLWLTAQEAACARQ